MARDLPPGLILQMALSAGIELTKTEGKVPIQCPLQGDRTPATLVSERNVLCRAACALGARWTARRFAIRCGLDWPFSCSVDPRRTEWTLKAGTQRLFHWAKVERALAKRADLSGTEGKQDSDNQAVVQKDES